MQQSGRRILLASRAPSTAPIALPAKTSCPAGSSCSSGPTQSSDTSCPSPTAKFLLQFQSFPAIWPRLISKRPLRQYLAPERRFGLADDRECLPAKTSAIPVLGRQLGAGEDGGGQLWRLISIRCPPTLPALRSQRSSKPERGIHSAGQCHADRQHLRLDPQHLLRRHHHLVAVRRHLDDRLGELRIDLQHPRKVSGF